MDIRIRTLIIHFSVYIVIPPFYASDQKNIRYFFLLISFKHYLCPIIKYHKSCERKRLSATPGLTCPEY